MTRIFSIMLSVLFLIFTLGSCHKKTVPVITARTNFPEAPKSTKPAISPATPEFIAAGKQVYEGNCNRCHDLKAPDAYTAERWDGILKSMIPKARITDDQAKQVTAYVRANAKK
jgi:mono/diheme cytochrome c family protein